MKRTVFFALMALLLAGCRTDRHDHLGPDSENGITALAGKWTEVPEVIRNSPDYRYITHDALTYKTRTRVRNYTACYDVRRHNPVWVAYPLHDLWTEGGFTRPQKDPWRPDPEMEEGEQSVIYGTDWNDWPWKHSKGKPKDGYNYWSPTTEKYARYQGYIKGHLLRSADRGAGNRAVLLDLNVQTFYPTNIAPERYQEVRANIDSDKDLETLNHWTIVEGIAPDRWKCSDTLYIVTGCVYEDETHKVVDASSYGEKTDRSKECVVPTARYKAFLRTKAGNTGKSVAECKADELMTIAFWFPQCFDYSNEFESLPALRTQTMSVAELEKRLGHEFSFFPSIPSRVKKTYDAADWPDLERVIDQPLDENYTGGYIFY